MGATRGSKWEGGVREITGMGEIEMGIISGGMGI